MWNVDQMMDRLMPCGLFLFTVQIFEIFKITHVSMITCSFHNLLLLVDDLNPLFE